MKKVFTILSACLVLACVMVMAVAPVSAATPKDDIIAAAKEAIPEKYQELYLPMLENVLMQVDVDADQAAAVIANIEAAKAAVSADKGGTLDDYTKQEQAAVLAEVKDACATLGLVYEIKPTKNPDHEGDIDFVISKADGTPVANIDLDVKKTNVEENPVNYTLIVAGAVLAVAAVAAVVFGKKLVASR